MTCDAPLVSRRVERVGLCAVCALVDASSVSRAHAHARRHPAVPLNIRKSGTNHKQYAPQKTKDLLPAVVLRGGCRYACSC